MYEFNEKKKKNTRIEWRLIEKSVINIYIYRASFSRVD